MSEFLNIEKQPLFPACDLSEQNARVLPAVIDMNGIEARARQLEQPQAGLYRLAHHAIELFRNEKIQSSEQALRAFSEGFATFEAIDMIIAASPVYDTKMATQRVQSLYTRHLVIDSNPNHPPIQGFFLEDAELSRRLQMYPVIRTRLRRTIAEIGRSRDATPEARQARDVGGFIGFELQRPSLDQL